MDFALRERSSSSEHQHFQPSIAREPPQQFFHPSSFAMHNHLSGNTGSLGDYKGIVNHWVAYLVAHG